MWPVLLSVFLLYLKAFGYVDWSWWIILLPVYGAYLLPYAFIVSFAMICFAFWTIVGIGGIIITVVALVSDWCKDVVYYLLGKK